MSNSALSRAAAIGAVVALGAAPAALAARPDDPGSQGQGHSGTHGKSGKGVTYVFKGTYLGAGGVDVDHGNAHARKADLVGAPVSFDLTSATFVVADTNADGAVTVDDVAVNDRVVVKARLPRKDPGDQPYSARQLVDQTHAPDSSDD